MAPITSSDRTLYLNNDKILNTTQLYMEQENFQFIQETRNVLARKKIAKSLVLKLSKKMYPANTSYSHPQICTKQQLTTSIPVPATSVSLHQNYSYPLHLNDWQPFHTPLVPIAPIPIIIPTPSPILATPVCPFTAAAFPPIMSPIIPQTFVQEDILNMWNYTYEYNYTGKSLEVANDTINSQSCYLHEESLMHVEDTNTSVSDIDFVHAEPSKSILELYLDLPKDLFPPAKVLALDPNPIIDEFCKVSNIQSHTPWLLDLEFGIPKLPITRPIPTYNVKFNSINCKNAPDAIHPGFESCEPDFKKVLLFYYDCVVSAWYRGFIIMNCDRSVDNFQSWLLLPMQVLGMCWP